MEHFYKIELHDAGANSFRVVLNQNSNFKVLLDGVTSTNTIGVNPELYLVAKVIKSLSGTKPIYGSDTVAIGVNSIGQLIREYSEASNNTELAVQFENLCEQIMISSDSKAYMIENCTALEKHSFSEVHQNLNIMADITKLIKSLPIYVSFSSFLSGKSEIPLEVKFLECDVHANLNPHISETYKTMRSNVCGSMTIGASGTFAGILDVNINSRTLIKVLISQELFQEIFTAFDCPVNIGTSMLISKKLFCSFGTQLALVPNAIGSLGKAISSSAEASISVNSGTLVRVVFRYVRDIDSQTLNDVDNTSLSELYTIELN